MRDSEELLRLVHTAMVGAGVDYEAIYAELEYTADTLAEPEHRTRHEIQKWFWATAERVMGDTDIGLTLCPYLPAFRGNAMEYIFLSSPTQADGLNAVLDYRRLVSDAFHMDLVREPGVTASCSSAPPTMPPRCATRKSASVTASSRPCAV